MRAIVVELSEFSPKTVGDVLVLVRGIPVLHASGKNRKSSAGMRQNQFEVRIFEHHTTGDEARDGSGGFEINFIHEGTRAVIEVAAARRYPGMHIEDGVAPVELLPDRLMNRIAGPPSLIIVRVNADTVAFQCVV